MTCDDIDECTVGSDNCDTNASCVLKVMVSHALISMNARMEITRAT